MTIEEMLSRLEAVERANRRMRAGGVAVLVLVAGLAAMGQGAPAAKLARAERFEVLDGSGKVRVALGVSRTGSAGLTLFDSEGKDRAILDVDTKGRVGLSLNRKDGRPHIGLSVDEGNTPLLTIANRNTHTGATLILDSEGFAQFEFTKDEVTRAVMGLRPDGSPSLSFFDKDGKVNYQAPPK